MKTGDKIKVYIYDVDGKEIITRNSNKVFTVVKKGNRPGIYWTDEWTSLKSFSTENGAVLFEPVL